MLNVILTATSLLCNYITLHHEIKDNKEHNHNTKKEQNESDSRKEQHVNNGD